jgi:hypothetical protein|tara:strand:+ start:118 stop:1446 length:1329 start_codon:yes stop_codon:yes gene_type:complete
MELLKILQSLFGKNYLNKVIGTGTNVSKPIKLDKNSPFKLYSDKAFNDPEVLAFIEKKLAEYGPYALSNRNMSEVKNFEMNARRLLNAKNKKTGSTIAKSDKPTLKPEAEIFDIRTQETVKPEGIMKLKTELGLPEGVEPGSIADKAIQESVEYKTKQQGVKSILDDDYVPPKTTPIDEDEIADIGAKGYSARIEGQRRAVIRQILLKDTRIDLPDDIRNSLKNYDDLKRGASEDMDPLKIFDNYYERDNEVLGNLDGIIDTAENEFKAADTFLSMEDNFKPKKIKTVEEYAEDGDFDPGGMADGGRIGFSGGGIKELLKRMNKKFGEGTMKTADKVKLTDEMLFERDNRRLLEELQDYKEIAPKFYLRMNLKLKYPGISDDLLEKIMADDDPQRIAEVMATMDEGLKMMEKGMSTDEILNTFKKTPRTKNASGGLNYLMGM